MEMTFIILKQQNYHLIFIFAQHIRI